MRKYLPITLLSLLLLVTGAWLLYELPDMQGRIRQLEQALADARTQTEHAGDYIAIANLQAAYGYYVDKSRWDDAADLFTQGATLEIAGRGLFAGQDSIRSYLQALGPLEYGRMYNHMQLQPVINIADDGMSARARWRSFMQVGRLGAEARWGEATYENEYVKDDGIWKISKLHSYIGFYVEYDEGWHRGGVELPQRKENTTPDSETTVEYGAYPEVFIPPYHYDNPVTGE